MAFLVKLQTQINNWSKTFNASIIKFSSKKEKKTINLKEASFTQAINISAQWCKEWGEDLLSEEVLADRISELIKTKKGLRGFFAYALSDKDCFLLDKLPFSLIYKLNEGGDAVTEIVVKNLIMSSAQILSLIHI